MVPGRAKEDEDMTLKQWETRRNPKTSYFAAAAAALSAALLCAVTSLATPSPVSAEAKVQGQDVGDKNCERIDGPESSTFGKCKSVCQGKDVTWDAVGRRYVCKAAKAAIRTPLGQVVPVGGLVQNPGASQTPTRQPVATTAPATKAPGH
jgi:hypothetical protein